MKRFAHILTMTGLLCLLPGCFGDSADDAGGTTQTPLSQLALHAFASDCGDFLDYVAAALTEQLLAPYYCLTDACPFLAVDGAEGVPPPAAAAPDRVSGTNTQEADVDEADIVKADSAGRIYVLAGRSLVRLEAYPPAGLATRPLQALDLAASDDTFYGQDFFLDEEAGRAVVLGSRYDEDGGEAVAVIVDASDPAGLVELSRLSVDGYGNTARRIGSRVHRVSNFHAPAPAWLHEDQDLQDQRNAWQEAIARGDEAEAQLIKAHVRAVIGMRVSAEGADAFLPRLRYQQSGLSPVETALACHAVAHPQVTTGLGLVLIDSFDVDGTDRALAAVVNNSWMAYASASNLYLAQSSRGWWFDRAQAEETALYRLSLPATGPAVYQALGKVDGILHGVYALSEYQGHLRVATTQWRTGANLEPRNHVTVLRADRAGEMEQSGAIRNLAPGETIQGVRFDGARGYVVTFRNIDPLFALDLADPMHPVVQDELKIPGFSSYLMPLGQRYLLTIGRAGTDEALNGKVGIQLFDVADAANIFQIAGIEPAAGAGSYSWSAAGYEPHAFSYFPDSADAATPGTLSIPLQAYSQNDWLQSFSGFLVVRVNPAADQPLVELGRISHQQFATGYCAGGGVPCRDAIFFTDPRRSVFMQDAFGTYLYTLSSMGVIASDATAPGIELGSRPLPYEWVCCYAESEGGG